MALFLAARTVLVARAAPGAVEKVKGCGYADVGSWTKARDALLSMPRQGLIMDVVVERDGVETLALLAVD